MNQFGGVAVYLSSFMGVCVYSAQCTVHSLIPNCALYTHQLDK